MKTMRPTIESGSDEFGREECKGKGYDAPVHWLIQKLGGTGAGRRRSASLGGRFFGPFLASAPRLLFPSWLLLPLCPDARRAIDSTQLHPLHTHTGRAAGASARGTMAAAAAATPLRSFQLPNSLRLAIGVGDITKVKVDGIVNAANERMLGGGGVDGAIHRAAGGGLYDACKQVPEVRRGVRCPTGEARITPGFELPARFVVHTVGPIYEGDHESEPLLRAAHRSCLDLASREGLTSLAFPALSCGVYGYPVAKAARVAVKTCVDFSERVGGGCVWMVELVLCMIGEWLFIAHAQCKILHQTPKRHRRATPRRSRAWTSCSFPRTFTARGSRRRRS